MGIVNIHARPYPNANMSGNGNSSEYQYKLGMRELHNSYNVRCGCISNGLMHHCLLYHNEIFELLQDGYHRRKTVDCEDFSEYKWDSEICGTSTISPDDLDDYIRKFGNLTYDKFFNNCQDFVLFCLKKMDCTKSEKYRSKMCSGSCK